MSKEVSPKGDRISLEEMLSTILNAIKEYESNTGMLSSKKKVPKRLRREQEVLLLVLQQAYEVFCDCVSQGYLSKDNRRIGHAAFDQLFRISQVRV